MSEPKYETLTLGQALDAVANNEQVEWRACSTKLWNKFAKEGRWGASEALEYEFRRLIQPKKKLVPFTQETWPIGAWVKLSDYIYCTTSVGVLGVYIGGTLYRYDRLLEDGCTLLTIENGRVVGEKPCGLEVEE